MKMLDVIFSVSVNIIILVAKLWYEVA
jgi:hypothetical protein